MSESAHPASAATEMRESYRINDDPDQVAQEGARLRVLAEVFDPRTRTVLTRLGLGPGWRCLDVGTGAGTVAQWMAEQVGPNGWVLAVDVDTRFAPPSAGTLEVRRLDVVAEPLPDATFDLVHARGVLQHLAQREVVLDKMVAATARGGWVVVQDSDWIQFDAQEIPEPFATLSSLMRQASTREHGWDGNWGRRMIPAFQARGLVDVRVEGRVFTMVGGTPSAEWYVAALARAAPLFVEAGALDAALVERAVAQARDPSFAIVSPISIVGVGRKP
jgi:SAM-dependent methyltransferase